MNHKYVAEAVKKRDSEVFSLFIDGVESTAVPICGQYGIGIQRN